MNAESFNSKRAVRLRDQKGQLEGVAASRVLRWAAAFVIVLSFTFLNPWRVAHANSIEVGHGDLGKGNLTVTETGKKGLSYDVYATWNDQQGTHYFVKKLPTNQTIPCGQFNCIGAHLRMDRPLNDGSGLYDSEFTFQYQYSDDSGVHKVSNYEQRTADPGTLFAAVFVDGQMVDSLEDWFALNYPSTPIFQPDFIPVDGGDIYYGVNLADLVEEGRSFVEAHQIGEFLVIGANGGLPGLPHYMFSSTPPDYVSGVGWVGTPVDPGTQLEYAAFHETALQSAPEPATVALLLSGLAGMAARRLRHVRMDHQSGRDPDV
jgi:hypothetical protein